MLMKTNAQIIKAAGITTGDVAGGGSGLLDREQSRKFITQAFEKTALGGLVRREFRRSKTGVLDKIGIASRIMRKKVEGVDANADGSTPILDPNTGQVTGYRVKPNFTSVPYATKAVRVPWEISEETLRENIEGQGLEATITNLMARQVGLDLEDLCLNGDVDTPNTDPDNLFLYVNDGWLKQISNGGHVYDATNTTGEMSLDMFYGLLQLVPNKYNNGNLRWLMSPHRTQEWELFLLNQGLKHGANFPDSLYKNPASIPAVGVPSIPDDKIALTDPKNLIEVFTYDVIIRKTTEGKEAVMADKRYYGIHLDFDSIIEELDAVGIIENIGKRR
jgi:hypothetical protein